MVQKVRYTLSVFELISQIPDVPRNPEENAKIERWWQHIEKLESYNDIGIVVELYNNTLFHSALTPYLGQKSTPANAYDMLPKFDINQDSIFNQLEFTP